MTELDQLTEFLKQRLEVVQKDRATDYSLGQRTAYGRTLDEIERIRRDSLVVWGYSPTRPRDGWYVVGWLKEFEPVPGVTYKFLPAGQQPS